MLVGAVLACAGVDTAAPAAVEVGAPVITAAPPDVEVVAPAAVEVAPLATVAPAPAAAPATILGAADAPDPPPAHLSVGVHEHQVEVDGVARRWTTVVPTGGPASAVVVVLHGVGGQGRDMRSAGFEPLAAGTRVVLAYPDAHGGAWNDGRPGADPVTAGAPVDDGRFLARLIDETVARTGAGAGRVAVVGFSAGAVMASRLACDPGGYVGALVLVAGTAGQGFDRSCRPGRPVAVLVAAGAGDPVVPYAGGRIANWGTKRRGYLAGVEELFEFWRAQNGCLSVQAAGAEARGTGCRSPVVRYRVAGTAHEWFRPPRLDTTNVAWEFVLSRFAALP